MECKQFAETIIAELVELMRDYPNRAVWIITHCEGGDAPLIEAAAIMRRSDDPEADAIRLVTRYAREAKAKGLELNPDNYGIRSRLGVTLTSTHATIH